MITYDFPYIFDKMTRNKEEKKQDGGEKGRENVEEQKEKLKERVGGLCISFIYRVSDLIAIMTLLLVSQNTIFLSCQNTKPQFQNSTGKTALSNQTHIQQNFKHCSSGSTQFANLNQSESFTFTKYI